MEQINGGPQQEFSDADQVDIAQNNIAPTESVSSGNPLQTNEEESISDQDETVIETAEIGPEQSEVLGQPSQVITEDTESEIQFAEIAPELTDLQGSPQEEAVNVEESFQLAEAEEIPPQEGTAQDYIESVFEEKLSEGLEKGLTSEEATIAAIEAGRDAVKESASSPEEINEFAENFNNNIIEDINSKIEKIENDIQQIKEKNINEEAIETEVAQVEEEVVPQEEITEPPTEVAEADIFSQDINDQVGDQVLDSIVSESTVSSDDTLEQIETLSSLSDEAEDVEINETDEVPDEESEEISNRLTEKINNDLEDFKNILSSLPTLAEEAIYEIFQNKILEISYELAGYQIDKMPEKYEKKIKSFLKNINCYQDKITVEVNDKDFEALSKIKNFNKNEDKKIFISNKDLSRGDIILNCDGMRYSEKSNYNV